MAIEAYKVVSTRDGWGIQHGGKIEGSFATREAAFEAAVAPASNALKAGHGVSITVEPTGPNQPSLGSH